MPEFLKDINFWWSFHLAGMISMGLWELAHLVIAWEAKLWTNLTISNLVEGRPEFAFPLAVYFAASGVAIAAHLVEMSTHAPLR